MPAEQYPDLSMDAVIAALDLAPHPEGGYFRETYRDPRIIDGRAASTAIYYLLGQGAVSRWHRVDATEIWHWYAGAPLALTMNPNARETQTHNLGPRIDRGEQPQIVVPSGVWQTAKSLGEWTLAGCTVAPGFEFSGFEMAPEGWQPR